MTTKPAESPDALVSRVKALEIRLAHEQWYRAELQYVIRAMAAQRIHQQLQPRVDAAVYRQIMDKVGGMGLSSLIGGS